MRYDAIIVGGGPSGLSAALVLGRSRRRVLVIDAGRPRNYASRGIHNLLTRDGVHPHTFATLARAEVEKYGVEVRRETVVAVRRTADDFRVTDARKRTFLCSVLLLATGVTDRLPQIGNIERFYGAGVHHCPYCDGYEHRDEQIAAYGSPRAGLGLGANLLNWSKHVTVLTDGRRMNAELARQAEALEIDVRTERVLELRSVRGKDRPSRGDPLGRVVFVGGAELRISALFFNTGQSQRSKLPINLGCVLDRNGGVMRDRKQRTGVPGLYLAGDASKDVQFVIVAAAEGAKAGVAMNRELQDRERNAILARG